MTQRILCRKLDSWVDPQWAFAALYGDRPFSFWLDSGVEAKQGTSYLGAVSPGESIATASVSSHTVTVECAPEEEAMEGPRQISEVFEGTIFDFLREKLEADRGDSHDVDSELAEVAFRLGWVGWLGYELGAQTQGTHIHSSRYPDARLIFIDRMLAFDHEHRTVTLFALSDATGVEEWFDRTTDALSRFGEPSSGEPSTPTPIASESSAITWRHNPAQYLELVRQCQAFIARGDAYQLCLTNEIRVDVHPDPLDAYFVLRALNPSHHGGFLRFGEVALLSSSPEQFLEISPNGVIATKPIKGTRPRGVTSESDAALRSELLDSEKERAENLMIVDLMRNDLGRVAATGSVAVTSLFDVESYSNVHQLVSTVQARLGPGVSGVDVVASCFPAGSMTGAPKISAMTILDQLERGSRGLYSGVFGYFGLDGRIDLAMIIRSIVLDKAGAAIGTGGGITALSVPEEELEETVVKAALLLSAVGVLSSANAAENL